MIKGLLSAFLAVLASSGLAALIPASEIFNSAAYQAIKINPSGQYMLAKAFLDGRYQLLAFKGTTLKAIEVFELTKQANDDTIIDYDWVDDDTAYVRYRKGNRIQPLQVIDFSFEGDSFETDTFEVKPVGFVVSPVTGVKDSVHFARLNSSRTGYDLYLINLSEFKGKEEEKEQQKLFSGRKRISDDSFEDIVWFHVDKRNQFDMFKELDDDGEQRYFLRDPLTGRWIEFYTIPKMEPGEGEESKLDVFSPLALLSDDQVAVISNVGRDRSAVVSYDFRSKRFGTVLYESPYYDINWAVLDSTAATVSAVHFYEKGSSRIKYLDRVTGEATTYLKQKIGVDGVYIADRSADGRHLVVYTNDSAQTSRFYYYNADDKRVKLLQNTMPALHAATFSKGEYLSSKNDDGQLLEGFLTLPAQPLFAKSPLVVIPHGGPLGVRDSNDFDAEVQFLANRGYAVLRVNFRGSFGYGKQYIEAGRRELGHGIERDINNVVDIVAKDSRIDSNKICLYGQSYGGYSSLFSALHMPERYKCAISAFGVTDLPLLFRSSNWQKDRRNVEAVRWVVGDMDADHAKLRQSSPLYLAEQMKVPVLLMSGLYDEIALSEHSNRMRYLLEHHKKDVDYIAYKTRHGHSHWDGERHQYLSTVDFLDRVFSVKREYHGEDRRVAASEFYLLGEMLRSGDYAGKDLKKAETYLRRAHELGSQDAAKSLRIMGIYEF